MSTLEIYTDGSCFNNPGPCGYAFVIKHSKKNYEGAKFLGFGTNNIAELTAPIEALEFAKLHNLLEGYDAVRILSDSMYTIQGITKWIHGWKASGWRTKASGGGDVKNKELWVKLDEIVSNYPLLVTFKHVRAHSGEELNERCDTLAKEAITHGIKTR